MYRLEKFGGLRLAGVPERQSKAFDFFVSREPFLVSAFAFEQCKLLVKQRREKVRTPEEIGNGSDTRVQSSS